ncbi:MAG TPA: tetratricopeptide repeat-containing glycosyltransferase family protein [Acetobacteraceae bacterium]|nr:tetratricopeptide repeat-containing glycosyltransferase family protein [Acetobacteraceae bacterium]
MRRAVSELQWGRAGAAASVAERLLARNDSDIEAVLLLGLARGLAGDAAGAAPLLARVAVARPAHAHPCRDLAGLLRNAGRPADAEPPFRAAREFAPEDERLAFAHAAFLHEAGRLEEAAERLGAAASPVSRNLLGILRAEQGRAEEAMAAFRAVLEVEPDNAGAYANLGAALAGEARMEAAFEAYDAALALAPDQVAVRLGHGYALLKAGRLVEGFAQAEWRLRQPGRPALPPQRRLHPGAPLARRRVLLTQDEGMGDTLMMLRYVPMLARAGARVIVWVPRELQRIASALPGIAEVMSGDGVVPPCDWIVPFLSLPYVFATTLGTVPPPAAIVPDPAMVAAWAARLPARGGLRVGLCWAGAAREGNPAALAIDRRRSLTLAALAPLASVPGVQLVSLQKGPPSGQVGGAGFAIHDPMGAVADFADTASIIANLDVVVSADTAVVHLAASMGARVLLLDRFDNCWRWLTRRADSPWYPSLRIIRQERPGDWEGVVARVRAMIAAA